MTLKKIFFSYSRVDGADFSLRLAQDLKNAGFNVWIDQQDIRAGSEWDLEIEKALETCDCLLFIESEKSVVSNNVLDEVYYALDHQKKVIPVIYHDSKTPYRLQRLQHVDFSKNYDEGLASLIRELKGNFRLQPVLSTAPVSSSPQRVKYIYFAGGLFLIAAVALVLLFLKKSDRVSIGESHFTDKESIEKDTTLYREQSRIATDEATNTIEHSLQKQVTKGLGKDNNIGDEGILRKEVLEGDWRLVSVEPKVASRRGYLKIDALDGDKIDIKTTSQFYYTKTNDTSFLSVFNVIANCTSCTPQGEMKLKPEDIAVGSQTYSILKQDKPGVGKAGDTVMSAGSNKSIRGTVSLRFTGKNTAAISVSSGKPVELSYGLILPAFVYTFRFEKLE
ncbi:MAG: toll/interleukin-1 receptor domain-containing protein [Sphingobacteriales bacterium]|nr:toll/interleukin-1 receptor domain-containing protein [Sphingobacteriales bacterium]OJY84535.1 MAG: hypothetical protein BGP14_20095 [Sphingobacteriales bacterium 44-15]